MYDLVIKNGQVILPDTVVMTDIGIKNEKIEAIGSNLDGKEVFDATGLIIAPGMVDAHVHITDPGGGYRDDWEGYPTGTAAAAKGGVTSIIEMPLNQVPATVDQKSLQAKLSAGTDALKVDVFSFGGLTPYNLDGGIQSLDQAGVIGYKAFMATAGDRTIEGDFENVDDYSLYEGMKQIAKTGHVLALHCENAAITDQLGGKAYEAGLSKMTDYVDTRPAFTEVEAIKRAIYFAEQTGCRIHICHVACHEGVEAVLEAQKRGVDVTCETCTHYLYFDKSELNELGPVAKCSPPIREKAQQESLWDHLFNDEIQFVTSDHSPCSPDLKEKDNAFEAWGGIAGIQSNLDVLFDEGVQKREMSLNQWANLIATHPAERFGLKNKGSITIGKDADFVMIQPDYSHVLSADDLAYRHKISPYVGREFNSRVYATILRGELIYHVDSGISNKNTGQFMTGKGAKMN